MKKYLLGFDIGSSSVKAALVESESGRCCATASYPHREAPIKAVQPGWAEQRPEDWWSYLKAAAAALKAPDDWRQEVAAIGISYQMHGLVCVDREGRPLRDSIIWCDSRAVPYGQRAMNDLGSERCLEHLLNSPGNFTASKLAWVRENEPATFERIDKIMLPGDYIALRLTGEATTTVEGLSEGMMWDFKKEGPAEFLLDYYGIPEKMLSRVVPTFGEQGRVTRQAAAELGVSEGTPVSYRAGDQPNNALSLDVFEPGEVAATAGTSGVVYGVLDRVAYDPLSRVNTFAHVNHDETHTRLGVLLCINGTGILNSWCHNHICPELTYDEINTVATEAPIGADGLTILPFGNGAERVLQDRNLGASIHGLDLVRHQRPHLLRAAQEGIVFALAYGMKVMEEMGMSLTTIKAGRANMFQSRLFTETLAGMTGATINLCETDGAAGAARGAGIGCGLYSNHREAFAALRKLDTITPAHRDQYAEAYGHWRETLEKELCNR